MENKEKFAVILTFDDGSEARLLVEEKEDWDEAWDKASSFYKEISDVAKNGFVCHPDKWESYNISKIQKIRMEGYRSEKVEIIEKNTKIIKDYWSWSIVKKD